MLEKKTVIDQITIARDGTVNLRFGLLVIDDGLEVGKPQWHRVAFSAGADIDAVIAAVNADITTRPELRAAALASDAATTGLKLATLKSIGAAVSTQAAASLSKRV